MIVTRDGQDQRADGVADPVRDHLGVVDGREHRSHQEHPDHGHADGALRMGDPGDREESTAARSDPRARTRQSALRSRRRAVASADSGTSSVALASPYGGMLP